MIIFSIFIHIHLLIASYHSSIFIIVVLTLFIFEMLRLPSGFIDLTIISFLVQLSSFNVRFIYL
jgi:hypothetical protein